MVRVAIVGATGYAGMEALRLLAGHPQVEVTYLGSHSQAGQPLAAVHPGLAALGPRILESPDAAVIAARADAALLALPARGSLALAPDLVERGVRVIDFGADFRLRDAATYAEYYGGAHTAPGWLERAVYGLTEFHRPALAAARLVANPGCYPTAALLALWPALAAGAVDPQDVIVDAKSGATGAGRQLVQSLHFSELAENLWPYKLGGAHRHGPEIEQELAVAAGRPVCVTFSPHQAPMARGLLATCYARLCQPWDEAAATAHYRSAYAAEPFIQVLERELPATKATLGSNLVQVAVRVDTRARRLVAVAAIDNLGKGAAGQAIQNLNCVFGLEETLGLPRVGLMP